MNHTSAPDTWPEAMATVIACKYEAGAGRATAFGLPTSRHFRIAFNYWASNQEGEATLHTGEFSSERPVPQNTLFPIRYNPAAPHEHSRSDTSATAAVTRSPLIAIGIIGSIILTLIWFAFIRGCF